MHLIVTGVDFDEFTVFFVCGCYAELSCY